MSLDDLAQTTPFNKGTLFPSPMSVPAHTPYHSKPNLESQNRWLSSSRSVTPEEVLASKNSISHQESRHSEMICQEDRKGKASRLSQSSVLENSCFEEQSSPLLSSPQVSTPTQTPHRERERQGQFSCLTDNSSDADTSYSRNHYQQSSTIGSLAYLTLTSDLDADPDGWDHINNSVRRGSREHLLRRQQREIRCVEKMVERRANHRSRHCRWPCIRTRWSAEETARLVQLWERHGNNWALIKELDKEMPEPRLWNRTQVDLKDRMRNVKIGLMRRGDPVPDDYCQIRLSDRHLKSIARGRLRQQE
ncbi:conserved hypothetical protein [Coccidioides posadasii str. Silveira]|uniref:Myb-like domain-containing protein n=1 Tax=Coccidioides posadasii (strain RMSCC 757 / Silveira) TaxID=443226 RepID=E9DJQ9_COCPS|nr:conserved hypothetical protein [Coccidioides posadasii str. Silveira]